MLQAKLESSCQKMLLVSLLFPEWGGRGGYKPFSLQKQLDSYSAKLEIESTAFFGALRAQRARSTPRKTVDLDYFFLSEHRHAGTYLNERSFYEEYKSGIIIVMQVHQHNLSRDWRSKS